MKLQEKKYSVNTFDEILKIIKEKGLPKIKEVTSIHYYGQHSGNDVEKFVEYPNRFEVHVLKEIGGKFTPAEDFQIKDKKEGFFWLKKRGFKTVNIVKMDYVEYEYKNGIVGLYVIDDFLYSVILNYPPGEHERIEKEFGLQNSEQITVPYNKQLDKMGRLRSKKLD